MASDGGVANGHVIPCLTGSFSCLMSHTSLVGSFNGLTVSISDLDGNFIVIYDNRSS